MISHDKKIILITPPKTGGTSILHELLQYSLVYEKFRQKNGGFDYYESLTDKQLKIRAKHKPLHDYKDYVDTYKLYGVVRNPYSRIVSWWKFRAPKKPFKLWLNTFGKIPFQRMTYKDYFQSSARHVDNIIHTESLQTDFDNLCDDIDIPRKKLPHKNKTRHIHYTEYYDEDTRQIVEEMFEDDIKYFKYKFGE